MAARTVSYSIDSLEKDLRAKPPRPLYLVEGDDALLAAEAVDALVAAVVPAAARDFNLDRFAGDDESARGFLAQARAFPFLAERRLVLVRRFEKLKLGERDEAALVEYMEAPSPTTVLVLVATKLDRRLGISKRIDAAAARIAAEALKDDALAAWARRRAAARGVELGETAADRLVELAGPALLDVANEIDKLAVRYAGAAVDAAAVEATVGAHRAAEIWAIHRALRPGNLGGFLAALGRVLETDDELVRIVALLERHVNDLLRVRALVDAGTTNGFAIAKRLGKNPYAVEQMLPQARAFTRRELRRWLRGMQRAEVGMKSRPLPQRLILEQAIVEAFAGTGPA